MSPLQLLSLIGLSVSTLTITDAKETSMTYTSTLEAPDYSLYTDEERIRKNPKLTAQEAIMGVVNILKAIREGKTLHPDLVKEVTGIVLRSNQKSSPFYRYTGRVSDDWFYTYRLTSSNQMTFSFAPKNEQERTNLYTAGSICVFSEEAFHQLLKDMGFTYKGELYFFDGKPYWSYQGYGVRVTFYIRGFEKNEVLHTCVSNIEIKYRKED